MNHRYPSKGDKRLRDCFILPMYLNQFWNSKFWDCAQGHCLDKETDDVGFLEKLMVKMVKDLPVKRDQVRGEKQQ